MVEQRQPKNNLNSQDSQVVTGNGAPNTDSTAVANPDTKTVAPLIDIERGVKGTVKWFSVMRGFGFIEREDKSGDVFVHSRAILKDNGQKLVSSLNEGEQVEFNVVKTDRGTEAREVTGPNGSTVQGSDFAPSLDELPRWLRHELFEYVIYGGGTGDRRGGGGGGYSNGNGSMTPNRRRNYDNGPASRRAADNRQTGPSAQTRNLRNRRPNNGRQGGQSDSVNDTQGRRDTQTRRDNQGQGGNPGNAQTKNTGDENQQPKPQRPRRFNRRRSAAKGDHEGAGQRDTEGETTEGAAHGGDGNNRKGHDGRRRSAGKPKQTVVNDGAGDRTRAANGEAKVVDAAK